MTCARRCIRAHRVSREVFTTQGAGSHGCASRVAPGGGESSRRAREGAASDCAGGGESACGGRGPRKPGKRGNAGQRARASAQSGGGRRTRLAAGRHSFSPGGGGGEPAAQTA